MKDVAGIPQFDSEGRFLGHAPRRCGEHRTVGSHRAWCHDCNEWCSPNAPCRDCDESIESVRERLDGATKLLRRVRNIFPVPDVPQIAGTYRAVLRDIRDWLAEYDRSTQ